MITSDLKSIACRIAEGQETRKEKHTCGGCLSTGALRFIHRHARQLDTTTCGYQKPEGAAKASVAIDKSHTKHPWSRRPFPVLTPSGFAIPLLVRLTCPLTHRSPYR